MAEIQRGEGKKYGVNATITVIATANTAASGGQTRSGMGKANIIDYSFRLTGDTILGRSGVAGTYANRIDHAHAEEATFRVEFYDTTIALADAAFIIPSKGMTITVTDSLDPQIAGDWIVDSAEKSVPVDGIGTGTISCWRDAAKALSSTSNIVAAS